MDFEFSDLSETELESDSGESEESDESRELSEDEELYLAYARALGNNQDLFMYNETYKMARKDGKRSRSRTPAKSSAAISRKTPAPKKSNSTKKTPPAKKTTSRPTSAKKTPAPAKKTKSVSAKKTPPAKKTSTSAKNKLVSSSGTNENRKLAPSKLFQYSEVKLVLRQWTYKET